MSIFVDSQFFHLLHIPLLQGRLWDESDTARGKRLALVNQSFVKRYFPNRRIRSVISVRVPDLVNHPPPACWPQLAATNGHRIIAVVGDARNSGLQDPVKPEIYFPYSLYMIDWIQVFVRAQGDPMSLERDVRRQIANVNPGQQDFRPSVFADQPPRAGIRVGARSSACCTFKHLLHFGPDTHERRPLQRHLLHCHSAS